MLLEMGLANCSSNSGAITNPYTPDTTTQKDDSAGESRRMAERDPKLTGDLSLADSLESARCWASDCVSRQPDWFLCVSGLLVVGHHLRDIIICYIIESSMKPRTFTTTLIATVRWLSSLRLRRE